MADQYAGGQWIDGEFYYEAKSSSSRRAMSKEEAALGVFGNFEDDYPGSRTAKLASASLAKPMMFVGGDMYKSADVAKEYQEGGGGGGQGGPVAMDEDDAPEPKSGLEIRREKRLEREQRKNKQDDKPAAGKRGSKPKRKIKTDKDFGSFQRLSGGLGMRMLQKMGYKGGALGRYGQGIVNPVKSKLRPQQMGLGYGGYKEKANMTQAELDDDDEDKTADQRAQKVQKRPTPNNNWKATAQRGKKTKRVYKTVEELKEEAEKRAAPELVIDMRGPHVRVTSLDKVADLGVDPNESTFAGDGWTPTGSANTLPELKWNMDALVEHTESEVHKTLETIKNTTKTVNKLKQQRDQATKQVKVAQTRQQNLSTLIGTIAKAQQQVDTLTTQQTADGGGGPLSQANVLAEAFEALTEKYPVEFKLYGVDRVGFALAVESIKKALRGWHPLSSSSAGEAGVVQVDSLSLGLVPVLQRWRRVFDVGKKGSSAFYQALLEKCVLSPLSLALSSCAIRDFSAPISLLERMKAAFPLSIYGHILTEVVAPRLKMEVNTWAPTKDTVPVHKWIHPWLDVLPQDSLEQIFVLLRTKLGATLRAWQPLDGSALLLISAWKGVWSRPDMWDFLSRYILPKLRHLSSKVLNVNPTNEDIKPFQALVSWHEVVPTHALASMLLTDFFPKWFRALTSWLSADSADSKAKFEEIARWYKGWRGMFPDTLLSHPVVEAQLRRALDLMNAAVSGNSLDSVLQQLAAAFPAQQEALRKEAAKAGEGGVGVDSRTKAQQQSGANRLRAQTAAAKAGAGGVSFKEAIERFAGRNGLEFVPNVRKGLRDGCQVYTFGRCNIYLKGQVVYAHVPAKGGGGQWRPVAIDELITMAR